MRRADPQELRTRAVPALTARLTEAELERWFPVSFDDIIDPVAVAEPSKGALVQLERGAYIVLYYGKDSGQLVVEIPEATDNPSAVIADLFVEVPLANSRVLWHRPDLSLPKRARAAEKQNGSGQHPKPLSKRSAQRVSLPKRHK